MNARICVKRNAPLDYRVSKVRRLAMFLVAFDARHYMPFN